MDNQDRFDWIIGGACWLTLIVVTLAAIFGCFE